MHTFAWEHPWFREHSTNEAGSPLPFSPLCCPGEEWRADGSPLRCPLLRTQRWLLALLWHFFSPFFIYFLFLFVVSLSPCLLCSRDAAKRKAWKLNRVGSLRNIYSSSSTNTEGNRTPPAPGPCLPAFLPSSLPMQTWKCSRMPPRCVCSRPCGLFILLFVCSILPFMFLSAYLNFDLSLQS